jgi:hypothetical protein
VTTKLNWHRDENVEGYVARDPDGEVVAEAWRNTDVPAGCWGAWRGRGIGMKIGLTKAERLKEIKQAAQRAYDAQVASGESA